MSPYLGYSVALLVYIYTVLMFRPPFRKYSAKVALRKWMVEGPCPLRSDFLLRSLIDI